MLLGLSCQPSSLPAVFEEAAQGNSVAWLTQRMYICTDSCINETSEFQQWTGLLATVPLTAVSSLLVCQHSQHKAGAWCHPYFMGYGGAGRQGRRNLGHRQVKLPHIGFLFFFFWIMASPEQRQTWESIRSHIDLSAKGCGCCRKITSNSQQAAVD